LKASSLRDVKFDFEFDAIEMGLLSITTSDFRDRLLLDWFESDSNDRRLILEIQGVHWAEARY